MNAGRWFGRVAAWATAHARLLLAASLILAAAAAIVATQIPTDAGVGTLTDTDTATYRATEEVRSAFGEEPVVVLARGELEKLLLTSNIFRLLRLEGCLSAKVPQGAKPIPGPCAELARLAPVQFVSGPATFLNEAVVQIDAQVNRLSHHLAPEQLREFLLEMATKYGITSAPSLDNANFVATVVFDLSRARNTPKARLAYLFPNSHSAQIVVRLKPDLNASERHRALDLITAAVDDTTPRQACAEGGKPAPCFALHGGSYVVSGAPVVVDAVARALRDALLVLCAVALAVMALTLLVVFRSRPWLLPLALALAATAIVFGLLRLTGGSLTMATIAVLPILIGLAVDYAIQIQARFDEALATGFSRATAARVAAVAAGPTLATACLATAAGFLTLWLSPIPMVRSFGLLLAAGVPISFLLVLTSGLAALGLVGEGRRGTKRFGGRVLSRRHPPVERLLALSLSKPKATIAVGMVLAVAGWAVGTQIETDASVESLAPQGLRAVRELNALRDATGVSGQLDVRIRARDLADPATIEWMAAFKQRVLKAGGFSGEDPSCLEAEICPGPALSDFLTRGGGELTRPGIEETLAALSPYDLEQVAPVDSRTGKVGHLALISFGVRARSLREQQALVDRVRAEIGVPGSPDGPPAGVEVHLAGLPVIAAESATELAGSRYWLTLAGLLAVALVLFAVYRSFARALLPLVPTVLATGWASLILWLSDIPLNPMSAALGALTIAIATEFAVILSGRFHAERGAGHGAVAALHRTYASTGVAVLASGVTAIAGFAALIASDVRMLRDFGLVTVIDLAVALLGVLVVLPAALAWREAKR